MLYLCLYLKSSPKGGDMAVLQTISSEPPTAAHALLATLQTELNTASGQALVDATTLKKRLRSLHREKPITTTIPELDQLLTGGLAPGRIVELVGRRTSGRLAVLLASLGAITTGGEVAALIDLGDQLDPQSATSFGVRLDRLLWARPQRLDDAVAAAQILLDTGFRLVTMDLGLPPLRGRATAAAWLRLRKAVETRQAALLVASPYRVTGCAAAVVVSSHRGQGQWLGHVGSPRLLSGLHAHFMTTRHRGHHPARSAHIFLRSPVAVQTPRHREALPAAEERGTRRMNHAQIG
jgi:hypothetical protein